MMEMNRAVLNSAANSSAPSIGASSVITDANSAFSGGSHVQRSASINTESYPRLPASPMSFSSNISGSSVMDGSSFVQQGSHQDHLQKQGASTATSQPTLQESNSMLHLQKKPRVDMRQENNFPQQVIQQQLQRQDILHLQGQMNPQLQALIQQHRILQQQHQLLQSLPTNQRAQVQQQHHHQHLKLQQQMIQGLHLRRPLDSGICARRLMQYIYHQRHRPPDNNILYWRKFVTEYFAPRARKRWCLSLYNNVGNHTLGVFPQSSMDAWQCNICGSRSGKGFDASFEVLPRLNKIKFDSGVIDELLFLDMPQECRLSSGIMILEYAKVTMESVYEHLRVVLEGQLRIIFSPDLKILLWEFCARHHEELLPRRLVAPHVNQFLQVAQKYQAAVAESGSAGLSPQDLQAKLNMFMMAGRQLARSLDSQSLNDLGFSKRYVRCLQISEVVNCMKDLIDFSLDQKTGPLESLRNYTRHAAVKLNQNIQEVVQTADQKASAKVMTEHPRLVNPVNNSTCEAETRAPKSDPQNTAALSSYQSFSRQNSITSLQEGISTFSATNQLSSSFQGHGSVQEPEPLLQASLRTLSDNCFQRPLQQPSQQAVNTVLPQPCTRSSQVNQSLQQQDVIQQLLQEMVNCNRGAQRHSSNVYATNANMPKEEFGSGFTSSGTLPARTQADYRNVSFGNGNSVSEMILNRNNSFKSISSNQNSLGNSSYNGRPDMPGSINLPALVQEISQEFADDGILTGLDGDMVYNWKS